MYAKPTQEELAAARLRFGDIPDNHQAASASLTLVILGRARAEKLRLVSQLVACLEPGLIEGLIRQINRIDEYDRKARSRLAKSVASLPNAPFHGSFMRRSGDVFGKTNS